MGYLNPRQPYVVAQCPVHETERFIGYARELGDKLVLKVRASGIDVGKPKEPVSESYVPVWLVNPGILTDDKQLIGYARAPWNLSITVPIERR